MAAAEVHRHGGLAEDRGHSRGRAEASWPADGGRQQEERARHEPGHPGRGHQTRRDDSDLGGQQGLGRLEEGGRVRRSVDGSQLPDLVNVFPGGYCPNLEYDYEYARIFNFTATSA